MPIFKTLLVALFLLMPLSAIADSVNHKDDPFIDLGTSKYHRLSEFHGKTILLDFWAPWCSPCVAELAELDKIQSELGSGKFEVVLIGVDGTLSQMRSAFGIHNITHLKMYFEQSEDLALSFDPNGWIPDTFIISPKGEILFTVLGAYPWTVDFVKGYIHE